MWRKQAVILQHDETDCGPAVLASVARHWGVTVPLARIRELAQTDLQGTSLYGLSIAAEGVGFRATGVRAHWENLISGEIPLPVIAPVLNDKGHGHFVVLYRVTKNRVVVGDPAQGLVTWTRDEFLGRWRSATRNRGTPSGGALLLLVPSPQLASVRAESRSGRLWALARPRLPLLLEAMGCAVLSAVLALGASFFVQLLVDRVLVFGSHSLLRLLGASMLLVITLRAVFSLFRQYLLVHLAQKVDLDLFVEYYSHLVRLPMRFFRSHRVGEIVARLDDAQKLRSLLQGTALAVALDGVMFVLAAGVLFAYHTQLATIVFAFVPAFVVIVHLLNVPIRKTERQMRDSMSAVEAHLVESLAGMGTIKALTAENWARRQGEAAP
ncbi:MAG: ABC transporter transmembrane domain-containing protein [Planctomycetota bacterium]